MNAGPGSADTGRHVAPGCGIKCTAHLPGPGNHAEWFLLSIVSKQAPGPVTFLLLGSLCRSLRGLSYPPQE